MSWYRNPESLSTAAGYPDLDPWQQTVLSSREKLILLNCSRQSGKSTVCALLAVWTMLCIPGSTIVLVSPSERQSKELYRSVLRLYKRLGRPVRHVAVARTGLELENESRVLVLPGSPTTIRGIPAVTLIVADEFSLISPELFASFSPMLAVSGGRLVGAFTPQGKQGVAWDLWSNEPEALKICVPATDCPRIPKSFLEKEARKLGFYWYQQEYNCKFQEHITAAFRAEDLNALLSDELEYDHDLMAG